MAIEFRKNDGISYDAPFFADGSYSGSITAHVTALNASDAIQQLSDAYPTHPSNSSMTQCSNDAVFIELIDCETRLYRVLIGYKFSSKQGGQSGESAFAIADFRPSYRKVVGSYSSITEMMEPGYVPGAPGYTTTLNNPKVHDGNWKLYNFTIPIIEFTIYYKTASSLLNWNNTLIGKSNSNAFDIGGYNYTAGKLLFLGVDEKVVYQPSLAANVFYNEIKILASPFSGFLNATIQTGVPYDSNGELPLVIACENDLVTFTVPPVPSIP